MGVGGGPVGCRAGGPVGGRAGGWVGCVRRDRPRRREGGREPGAGAQAHGSLTEPEGQSSKEPSTPRPRVQGCWRGAAGRARGGSEPRTAAQRAGEGRGTDREGAGRRRARQPETHQYYRTEMERLSPGTRRSHPLWRRLERARDSVVKVRWWAKATPELCVDVRCVDVQAIVHRAEESPGCAPAHSTLSDRFCAWRVDVQETRPRHPSTWVALAACA